MGIYIHDNSAGSVNFGNPVSLSTGANDAIRLVNNSGVTIDFAGGLLDVDTTSGAAFTATGGGTVNVSGATNSITTTAGGVGLNIVSTDIGASGVTFDSISVDGNSTLASGIVLSGTGGTAGLSVGGGTIENTTGAGISLTNTRVVSLSSMTISSTTGNGLEIGSSGTSSVCADVSGNSFASVGGTDIVYSQSGSSVFDVVQADPSGPAPNLSSVNGGASTDLTAGSFNFGATCP